MCDTCGCAATISHTHNVIDTEQNAEHSEITVLRHLLSANQDVAKHNRQHFDEYGVLAINLMSSPGAGKTALLETTILAMRSALPPQQDLAMAVIEGDLETNRDAERIRRRGVPAVQITTGNACHLDAQMVHKALHDIKLAGLDYLFIENVGNLVCPASFDLGQHLNIILLSTPEGDDKPIKYPVMFRKADLVLITKCDLLPILDDFSPERVRQYLRSLANPAPVLEISARTGAGLQQWLEWLKTQQLAIKKDTNAPVANI